MKKIRKSRLENMNVPEAREFLHNFDEAVESCEFISTTLAAQKAEWHTAYEAMVLAYETSLKADETDEIHALDLQTDNQLTAIKGAANGASKSFDPEMKAAGVSVLQAFISFPVKLNDNYISELAQVDTWLAAMENQELANLTKIGALALFNLVKDANTRMHELVGDRDLENINRPDRPAKRKAAIAAYEAFTEYINSYRLVVVGAGENESLDLFIDLVNSIIARFERVVLREKPTQKPGEATEDEGEDTDSDEQKPGSGETTNPGENETVNPGDDSTSGPGENTPGGSTGSDSTDSDSTGSGQKYTVTTYDYAGDVIDRWEVEVGQPIVLPTPPAGYGWNPCPSVMPDRNVNVTCYDLATGVKKQ